MAEGFENLRDWTKEKIQKRFVNALNRYEQQEEEEEEKKRFFF